MEKDPAHTDRDSAHRAGPRQRLQLVCALAAAVALVAAACQGAQDPTSSANGASPLVTTQPTATDGAEPLTPDDVTARLRTVEPSLTLVAQVDFRYDATVFPSLMFHAQTATRPQGSDGLGVWLGAILIYPTPAARQTVEPYFGSESIQAPGYLDYWDGQTHSEWVGVENVLIEVVMPGGSFGGRSPTPSELTYPESIRAALAASPPAAAT
jgi:hypothetical protein